MTAPTRETSVLAALVEQVEARLLLDPPDQHGAFLLADAAVRRLNQEEASRTGRTVAEVESAARARTIAVCRAVWAAEGVAEVASV